MSIEKRSVKRFNGEIPRERDSRLWWQCVSGLMVGVFLVGGFAVAAQQHFTAHESSLKNVELQRERERLKAEQKRLLLERENALSLDELKKRAKKIGMQELTAAQLNALETETPEPLPVKTRPESIKPGERSSVSQAKKTKKR